MFQRFSTVCLLVVIVGCQLQQSVRAEDWPRFRGVNGAGVASSTEIPSQWTSKDYLWTAKLGGVGNSSPIVWGDSVYVTAASEEEGQRWLIALDCSSGTERWKQSVDFSSYKKHKNNSFASSTPAADAKHVYVLWHSKSETLLVAYTHEGNEAWRYDLGPYLHGQGGAASPIVVGDKVLVAHDHKADSFLVAVDSATGKPAWKIPREGKRACYATPCVRADNDGTLEIVFTHCYEGIIGVDPESGKQLWHVDPFGRESQRALASPIVVGDYVVAGSGGVGGDRQIVAIKFSEDAVPKAQEAYRLLRQSPHVPTPLAIGDRLYLWSDNGIGTCCDGRTGDIIWQKRIGGTYFSSPIAVDDRIFNIDTSGEVIVIAAEDEFREIARNSMGEGSRASMAVGGNVLYIRTDTQLFAIGKP